MLTIAQQLWIGWNMPYWKIDSTILMRFSVDTQCVLAGAAVEAKLDGLPVHMWQTIAIAAGQLLEIGRVSNEGARAYLAVAGGIHCPEYLGSIESSEAGKVWEVSIKEAMSVITGQTLVVVESMKI
jgi:acetyl/propionyl-CoA carboxylase alpha subunit